MQRMYTQSFRVLIQNMGEERCYFLIFTEKKKTIASHVRQIAFICMDGAAESGLSALSEAET